MRILVCGGRDYSDVEKITSVLREYISEDPVIVHGAARGADSIAGNVAAELCFEVEEFPALWGKHGKSAGFVRNIAMLDTSPDVVIAFAGGTGTGHTVREANARGIPVRREL